MTTTGSGAPAAMPMSWREQSPSALIAHILEAHHRYTRGQLARIEILLAETRAERMRRPELGLAETLFTRLRDDLIPHMQKEEVVLFPFVEALEKGTARPFGPPSIVLPVTVMTAEHDRAGGILAELRCVTSGYLVPDAVSAAHGAIVEALAALDADLQQHMYLESDILFPKALELERS
jgi:regulator of cell morphogenesis and NO signaling